MLINVRMSTTVGIFTFKNMINTPYESLKVEIFQQLSIYEQFEFHTQFFAASQIIDANWFCAD